MSRARIIRETLEMGRFLIKFTKEGEIRYISHLDLLRVFQRAFRRTDVKLRYSQGFNPHPKISFAMPLSLGFESRGEYVEIETDSAHGPEEIVRELSGSMPRGVRVLACTPMAETSKTSPGAAVSFAAYTAEYRGGDETLRESLVGAIVPFLAEKEIISVKYSKKKKKDVETDIRPSIRSLSSGSDRRLLLTMMLKAGNVGNLNPEQLVRALCRFCGREYVEYEWRYRRQDMFFEDAKGRIRPLTDFKG